MKKTLLFSLLLISTAGLAGCDSAANSSAIASVSEIATSEVTSTATLSANTFEDQCILAGIDLTYEDPNAAITATEDHSDGEGDIVTAGASSSTGKYESINTYEELAYRGSLRYATYYWTNDVNFTAGYSLVDCGQATTLAEAANLEDAKYVTEMFPNDNTEYTLACSMYSIGQTVFTTADQEGNTNVAFFGAAAGFAVDEEGNPTLTVGWMGFGDSVKNIITSGKTEVVYIEYFPERILKSGTNGRTYGCKVQCEVDFSKTNLIGMDYYTKTPVTGTDFDLTDAASNYTALSVTFNLTSLANIG